MKNRTAVARELVRIAERLMVGMLRHFHIPASDRKIVDRTMKENLWDYDVGISDVIKGGYIYEVDVEDWDDVINELKQKRVRVKIAAGKKWGK